MLGEATVYKTISMRVHLTLHAINATLHHVYQRAAKGLSRPLTVLTSIVDSKTQALASTLACVDIWQLLFAARGVDASSKSGDRSLLAPLLQKTRRLIVQVWRLSS